MVITELMIIAAAPPIMAILALPGARDVPRERRARITEVPPRGREIKKTWTVRSAITAHTSDAVAILRLATVPFSLLKSSGLFGPEVFF